MIKDKKIFDASTMTLNGAKVRVLATPYHITRSEIPDDLYLYSIIKKKREKRFMVDDMDTTNTADFAMSIISHVAVPLGSDIELEHRDILYGPTAQMSIQEYHIETVDNIKLYVMMPTKDLTLDEIVKRLGAARRCFAIACGRKVDDVEVLNIVNDPYGINANFENETETERSIHHLTKNIKIMATATHILDMSTGGILQRTCRIEREVCEVYNLNRIDAAMIGAAVRKIQRDNNDLDIMMGKTATGTPSRPRLGGTPIPYHNLPGLGGEYDGDMMPPICDPLTGFTL
jgi:hypothetical protein